MGLWHKALQADPQNPHAVYNYGLHCWRAAAITDDQLIAQLEAVRATQSSVGVAGGYSVLAECGQDGCVGYAEMLSDPGERSTINW